MHGAGRGCIEPFTPLKTKFYYVMCLKPTISSLPMPLLSWTPWQTNRWQKSTFLLGPFQRNPSVTSYTTSSSAFRPTHIRAKSYHLCSKEFGVCINEVLQLYSLQIRTFESECSTADWEYIPYNNHNKKWNHLATEVGLICFMPR